MTEMIDVIGLGLGPSNLSFAALAAPVPELDVRMLEAEKSMRWHPGMLLPEAQLQVSFLKDLVSLVDPTSSFSFLNFLADKGRLYRFLVACERVGAFRQEFADYYQWAADRLPNVQWGADVVEVGLAGDELVVRTGSGAAFTTRNLVLGSGRRPKLPDFARGHPADRLLHSSQYLLVRPETAGRDVIVVGAGQSGAEIVRDLLADQHRLPSSLTWISSREGFLPLDDSPFTNEWFQPPYVEHFSRLPDERRAFLLANQRLASDGISEGLLRDLYRRLYYLDLAEPGALRYQLLASRRVVDLVEEDGRWNAHVTAHDLGHAEKYPADLVICCTGYEHTVPSYLAPIEHLLVTESGRMNLGPDYRVRWTGPQDVRIYAQNMGVHTHGIADPNLSLTAWRSARIVNSLAGREVYRTQGFESTIRWRLPAVAQQER